MQAYCIDEDTFPALPGSQEAVEAGCTCPVMDNHKGQGRGGNGARYGWFISGDCPVHNEEELK